MERSYKLQDLKGSCTTSLLNVSCEMCLLFVSYHLFSVSLCNFIISHASTDTDAASLSLFFLCYCDVCDEY